MQHGDSDLVGINPEKMQTLIDDLKGAHHTIASFTGEFAAALSAQGISLTTVHQAGQWAFDQAARLKARLEEYKQREHKTPPVTSPPAGSGSGSTGATGSNGSTTGTSGAGTTGTGATGSGHGQLGHHGSGHTGTTGGGTTGTTGTGVAGTGAGASPASGGGASGGGYAGAGTATPYVPAAAAGASAAHAAGAHAAAVNNHAAAAAKHVSHAAEHQESLPDRIWHDIERYASDPQFAAAFLGAIGAAGLAVLGASIAKSRKKSKEDKEAEQRQAVLDELTRSAGEYDGPPPMAWPADDYPEPYQDVEYQAQGEMYPVEGTIPEEGPKLRLVTAGAPVEAEPAADVAPENSGS